MVSVEVYGIKQQKWIPLVLDYDKWYRHFKDLSDRYVQPDHLGRYIVDSGTRYRELKDMKTQQQEKPVVKLVTAVAQAMEIAKSKIEREGKKEGGEKRKKTYIPPLPPKRLKHYAYNPEGQI